MSLNLLDHCTFNGPALPEPFVRFELEKELARLDLLGKTTGEDGKKLQVSWDVYRRKMRELDVRGGPLRVRHCIVDPLVERLDFATIEDAPEVRTREGDEEGGYLLVSSGADARLRVWTTEFDEDLDAPAKRGAAYRFSHLRIAQRVLLTAGERVGILTNGVQLRILISDPARPDSEVIIHLESAWKRHRDLPDSYRFLLALCQPKGIAAIPELVEKARLQQARVTKDLRLQARRAVEHFVQEILDHPANAEILSEYTDRQELAKTLWHEGLVLVYRLLFILKLESTDDPARSFSFASSSLWRNTFSPGVALARRVRDVLDRGEETGRFLEDALRRLFEMSTKGLDCSELHMRPLGGALFGPEAAPVLDNPVLRWGERAVAFLLDQLLWTEPKRGGITRQRVHYGALDVEDLGRVYEALLELEAGIATEPLCRLRRQKLEVVVPAAQGQRYQAPAPVASADGEEDETAEAEAEDEVEEETASRGKKTKIEWIEEIPPNRFYLRVGLGRKASGSYYTPHSFVRFLVQETLGPLCTTRSPQDDPNPGEILKLKILDPAMGSGHFLVEACRFLAEKLYEACRLCDERATPKEVQAETALDEAVKGDAQAEALKYRQRILDLPDPNNDIVQYLPSRAPEGLESGVSQRRAMALCRRLVAVHSLYGVDKNRLAVELAKLSLWIESHGEGLPLTFLDHRLVLGDSLTGAFFEHILTFPNDGSPLEGLFADGLRDRLKTALGAALIHIRELEATVGTSLSEMAAKRAAKTRLDEALKPLRNVAAAWAGRVEAGHGTGSDYLDIVRQALADKPFYDQLASKHALTYDLIFPEVFYPLGKPDIRHGFDVVLGNPPWDRVLPVDKEFFASYDIEILNAPSKRERADLQRHLLLYPPVASEYKSYVDAFRSLERAVDVLYPHQVALVNGERTIGKLDSFRLFMERNAQLLTLEGWTGVIVPAAFHVGEGATGIRRLYLDEMKLRECFSFQNKRRIFDIVTNVKFDVVVASREGLTTSFLCAFYLHDDEWLFGDRTSPAALSYTREFVGSTGGAYLTLIELKSELEVEIADVCFRRGRAFGGFCTDHNFRVGREFNMTDDSWRFMPVAEVIGARDPRDGDVLRELVQRGYFIVCEDDSIHQFTDHWTGRPIYLTHISKLSGKHAWITSASNYRLLFRRIATTVDSRSFMAAIVPPGWISASPQAHRTSGNTPLYLDLVLLALLNSFCVDWNLRLRITSTVNLFIADSVPLPPLTQPAMSFLAHSALILSCNHSGYADLWRDQLGSAWRQRSAPFTWPIAKSEADRNEVRAQIDAVVAWACGLRRDQYQTILATFNHKNHPTAPEACLRMFDELGLIGEAAFVRKYDSYWDISLQESLPEVSIELPGVTQQNTEVGDFALSSPSVAPKRGRRRK